MQERPPVTAGHEQARISQRGDRKNNQDRCEIFSHAGITIMVLADGMGGHPKGEVAAQILVDTAYHLLQKSTPDSFHSDRYITDVYQTAHRNIVNYGVSQKPAIYPRTTAVLVVIHNNLMQWSHMGDSRTYLFRHGRAHMRTMDHTRAEAMRLTGQIEDADSQARVIGRSGVSRCLGGMKKKLDIEITPAIRLQDRDILLLCSDGVWSQLKESELEAAILESRQSLHDRVSRLVNLAVTARHPHSDNATAIALCWKADNHHQDVINQNRDTDNIDTALDHLRDLIDKHQ